MFVIRMTLISIEKFVKIDLLKELLELIEFDNMKDFKEGKSTIY